MQAYGKLYFKALSYVDMKYLQDLIVDHFEGIFKFQLKTCTNSSPRLGEAFNECASMHMRGLNISLM